MLVYRIKLGCMLGNIGRVNENDERQLVENHGNGDECGPSSPQQVMGSGPTIRDLTAYRQDRQTFRVTFFTLGHGGDLGFGAHDGLRGPPRQ